MATNDLWEIVLRSTVQEQTCLNVWHYRGVNLIDPTADQVAEAFKEQVFDILIGITPNDVFFETLTVHNIFDTASPFILTLAESNPSTASILPTFNAYSFIMNVATNLTRPGHKRVAGVFEEAQVDGVITDASTITNLNDTAAAFEAPLIDTLTHLVTWAVPVIVKRILDGDSYRMPTSVGELVTNAVVSVAADLLISSQVSRKARVGG